MLVYLLTGELPAGGYHFSVFGYQPTNDAVLHAATSLRTAGKADVVLGSADGHRGADAGTTPDLDAVFALPALCGDALVITLSMTGGTSGYIELGASLAVP